jgi:hypothetical protein
MPGNTNEQQQIGLGLKFLVNYQHKRFKKSEKEEEKISGLISLFMEATIPGTPGITASIF